MKKHYKKGDLVRIVETDIKQYQTLYFSRLKGEIGIVMEKINDHSWDKELHPVYKVYFSDFIEYCSCVDIEKML